MKKIKLPFQYPDLFIEIDDAKRLEITGLDMIKLYKGYRWDYVYYDWIGKAPGGDAECILDDEISNEGFEIALKDIHKFGGEPNEPAYHMIYEDFEGWEEKDLEEYHSFMKEIEPYLGSSSMQSKSEIEYVHSDICDRIKNGPGHECLVIFEWKVCEV